MAVKPAQGEVIETQTRTRVLPADAPAPGERRPQFWDYVNGLSEDQWANPHAPHTLYLYRWDKESGEYALVEKYTQGPFTEGTIPDQHGGGKFRVMMRRGPQLIYNVEPIVIEGPPKMKNAVAAIGVGPINGGVGESALLLSINALVEELKAARGGDAAKNAMTNALELQKDIFRGGVDAVRTTLNGPPASAPPNPMDELQRTLMTAMVQKLLNPADPIDQFTKMLAAMNGIPGLNRGGQTTSIGVEIARGLMTNAPTIVAHVAQIMAGYAAGEAAKTERERITRGAVTVLPAAPAPPAPPPVAAAPVPSNVVEMSAPPQPQPQPIPQGAEMSQEQLFQKLEAKIVQIISNPELTPQEAANMALVYLDVENRGIVDTLVQHGEAGLRWVFENRAILKQIPRDERLDAFITAFIEGARPVAVPEIDPSKPPA